MIKKLLAVLFLFASFASPVMAQVVPYAGQTRFSNEWVAPNFGKWQLRVAQGSTSTGAYSITFPNGGYVTAAGAQSFTPFNLTTRITVGVGGVQETVTPTAVSGCGVSSVGTCTVTATFTYAHGAGTPVISGSGGFDEAVNVAHANGGGLVLVDNNTSITGAIMNASTALFPDVSIQAMIGGASAGIPSYFSIEPTTLSALATPAARSATAGNTQVISGTATGTFAASAYYVAVSCVDILGAESNVSTTYNFTATASVALNWAAPAAETGCVGWVPYAGLTGTSTMYRITPTAAICTLTAIETITPACAITNTTYGQTGSAAVTPSPNTTNGLAPTYVVNTYRPNTQSHSAFAYESRHNLPLCGGIEADYGPFVATVGGTTGQIQVLGTVPLPAGCLNQIGKTLRVTGKIAATDGTSGTPNIKVQLGPIYTTGTPTTVCNMAQTSVALTAAANGFSFSCTMTANAIGATGSLMPNGWALAQLQAGSTAGNAMVDTGTAAITNNLAAQDQLYITFIETSGTSTAAQLLDLHLELP